MSPKELAITEKTKLPLSLVAAICGIVITLVIWGKTLEARVEKVESIPQTLQAMDKKLGEISDRTARIEGALGAKK